VLAAANFRGAFLNKVDPLPKAAAERKGETLLRCLEAYLRSPDPNDNASLLPQQRRKAAPGFLKELPV
jgi:hypothetical protein